ncbi:hypothetical protein B0F88_11650 [Methylobacter tundripaludum]|uniref:Uncharacterized protein n=1 Tax=Methylobacter tundripaludum TaxID=173365 RepID=A0A2S6GMY7_9GAMM|nr:hypothetical protein B0F88_11650 [Methylobacter tundripaludum]
MSMRFMLVPKLLLGNPVREALGNRSCVALPPASMQVVASRNRTGSWSFQDCIPKLELGNERTLQFFALFVFFVDKKAY